jgi:hypothetical protein
MRSRLSLDCSLFSSLFRTSTWFAILSRDSQRRKDKYRLRMDHHIVCQEGDLIDSFIDSDLLIDSYSSHSETAFSGSIDISESLLNSYSALDNINPPSLAYSRLFQSSSNSKSPNSDPGRLIATTGGLGRDQPSSLSTYKTRNPTPSPIFLVVQTRNGSFNLLQTYSSPQIPRSGSDFQ